LTRSLCVIPTATANRFIEEFSSFCPNQMQFFIMLKSKKQQGKAQQPNINQATSAAREN
jgi:hypothetical protein